MTDKTLTCDVLIVGGGPAGLSVASTLPDDIKTVIVHQDQEIGLPVRTSGGSWLSDLDRLGVPADMYNVLERNEAYADRAHSVIPMGDAVPAILNTAKLYKWLATQSDHKDRTLLLATKFLTTRQRDDGLFESEIRARSGDVERIVSRYIVDGSGWHFAVLEALGLAKKPERLAVGTEYEYPLGKNDPHRGVIFMGRKVPAGYGWAFATAIDTLRIGVGVIQPDTDKSPRKLLDAVVNDKKYLKRLGITLEGEPIVHSGILPSVAYDEELIFGNVIRVGDSANFATPTAGEGIRICIELGRELGHRLGETVKTGNRRPLKIYEKRCRKMLKRDYKWGFLVNSRAAKFTPQQWNASVHRMGQLEPDAIVAMMRGEFGWGKIYKMVRASAKGWTRARIRRLKARFGQGS